MGSAAEQPGAAYARAMHGRIDGMLHDAEHADAGHDFARRLGHLAEAERLAARRQALLDDARALDPERTAPAWSECRLTQTAGDVVSELVVQDVSDLPPADDSDDLLRVTVQDLALIVKRNVDEHGAAGR